MAENVAELGKAQPSQSGTRSGPRLRRTRMNSNLNRGIESRTTERCRKTTSFPRRVRNDNAYVRPMLIDDASA
jgi:hypothetical protein